MVSMVGRRVIISDAQIQEKVRELAERIRADLGDSPILLICVLKGSFLFAADLCRHLGDQVQIDFIQLSSYGTEKSSSGVVQIRKDLDQNIEGRNVLIVEDIIDTGITLRHLRELLSVRQPSLLKVVSLLSKPDARKVDVEVEYLGFEIPNEFVVGYGLDHAEQYRNLPDICVID